MMKGYQLKCTIKGSKPPIWRRVIVPEKIAFYDLHLAIQESFGWDEYHLHEFIFSDQDIHISSTYSDFNEQDTSEKLGEEELIDGYIEEGVEFLYTYDFGDDWDHEILVERVVEDYGHRYPQVVDYYGDNLPEDCGGIRGYYRYLECLEHPEEEENKNMIRWAERLVIVPYDIKALNRRMERELLFDVKDGHSGKKKKRITEEEELQYNKDVAVAIRRILEEARKSGLGYEGYNTLKHIYGQYSKEDLIDMANLHGIVGYTSWNKKKLIENLKRAVLREAVIKQYFLCMKDEEMAEFEEALQYAGEPYEGDAAVWEYLRKGGYCGVEEIGLVSLPNEVIRAFEAINTEEFRRDRKRIARISDYCHAMNYLYGVTPMALVVDRYNACEEQEIDLDQLLYAYSRLEKYRCEFERRDDYFIDKVLLQTEREQEVIKKQADKPYYHPSREKIEDFAAYGIMDAEQQLVPLIEFMRTYTYEDGDDKGEEILIGGMAFYMHQLIRTGYGTLDVIEVLQHGGYCMDEEETSGAVKRLEKIIRDTRTIDNRGFTARELSPDQD